MTENKRALEFRFDFKIGGHESCSQDVTVSLSSIKNGQQFHVIEYSEVERLRDELIRVKYEREAASALGHERIVNLESKLQALEAEIEDRKAAYNAIDDVNIKLNEQLKKADDLLMRADGGLNTAYLKENL